MTALAATLLGVFAASPALIAQTSGTPPRSATLLPELQEHAGKNNLLVILATNRNDDRVFDAHLDLSVRWNGAVRRNIVPVDVLPPRRDVPAIARFLGVEGHDFAIVLINKAGDILHRTTNPMATGEILAILDLEEHR